MKIAYKIVSVLFLAALFVGCEDKVNDWPVDPDYEGLFKSLVFEKSKTDATSVEIRFTKSISATHYIFEFSQDSLLFGSIARTAKVPADTLTPYAESTTATRTEYRTTFSDFDGNTAYSVRMKSIDTISGLESKYSMFYFKTSAEQIIESWNIFTDGIELSWKPTNRITKITLVNSTTGEILVDRAPTATELSEAMAMFSGLKSGTNYTVTIYNNAAIRGVKTLKTSGLADGSVIKVLPTDSIPALLADAVAQGSINLTLEFAGGKTYEIGNLTIPPGVGNLSFTGTTDAAGNLPVLNMTGVSLANITALGILNFEYVKMIGDIGKYMLDMSLDGTTLGQIAFSGCEISSYRAIARIQNKLISIGSIKFDKCLVHNIGGYGVINIGGSNALVDSISFRNSTLTELTTQLMDVRTAIKEISIKNCTFCNLTSAMSQVFRFEVPRPLSVVTESNIFAGTNSGGKLNAVGYDMAVNPPGISFAGSYITSDIVINRYPFADISTFAGTTFDLFTDPANRDFTLKAGVNFAGKGTAGDPRWFK
jgi:hypothetical protein